MSTINKLAAALDFWLPPDEPYDPHTKDKVKQFKNMKWRQACAALDEFKLMKDKK
jgi:hypothetical protein